MSLLAALASFAFPGTGQAMTGRRRLTLIWALAGMLPVFLILWTPVMTFPAMAIRVAAATDAFIRVHRAKPGTKHLTLAGINAAAQTIVLTLIRALVLEAFAPPSTSMAPTVTIGDHIFVDKLIPRFTGYDRGDIVVFDHPLLAGRKYLKRIAAVGGDTVAVRKGVLHVNGVAAPHSHVGPAAYWDRYDEQGTWIEKHAIAYREQLGGHTYQVFQHSEPTDERWDHDFPRIDDPAPCGRQAPESAPPSLPPMQPSPDGTACTVPPGTYFMLGDNRDNSNDSRSWGVVPEANMVGRVIGLWWAGNDKTGTTWSRLGRID